MYSNPPVHGARIVADVVGNPVLFNEWKAEMEMMAGRIKNVRQQLYNSITSKDNSGKDWSFILKQIGMFSFTGLNKEQVIDSLIITSCLWSISVFYAPLRVLLHWIFQKQYWSVIWFYCIVILSVFLNETVFYQSDNMTNKWHVYMTKDGRISLAGLSLAKCEYLADAIIDSYHNVSWNSIKYFWWVWYPIGKIEIHENNLCMH